MNNFEKRLLLNYLEKLINHIDYRSYNFDELFESILKEFKIKRNNFKYDDDGAILTETIKQRTELKRKIKTIVDYRHKYHNPNAQRRS